MIKLLLKLSVFLVPLLILSINYFSYEDSGGDLNRVGKISIEKKYRDIFAEDFKKSLKYKELSEINLERENKIKILTVGDSFSQQKNYGYQNYLASLDNLKIVNLDTDRTTNRIQLLFSIANGDILDKIKVDYIILQMVEKSFVYSGQNLDMNKITMLKDLNKAYGRKDTVKEGQDSTSGLGILQEMIKYFVYNILYNFDERAYISPSYKMKITKKLFSTQENALLFYFPDIENLKYSTREGVRTVNEKLNILASKLKQKGVKLIVVPSPDKYDMYYDFIENNRLPKNNFFEYMLETRKDYIYINSKGVLNEHLNKGEKDIYFADDTHWSPIASEIIAKEIFQYIK